MVFGFQEKDVFKLFNEQGKSNININQGLNLIRKMYITQKHSRMNRKVYAMKAQKERYLGFAITYIVQHNRLQASYI